MELTVEGAVATVNVGARVLRVREDSKGRPGAGHVALNRELYCSKRATRRLFNHPSGVETVSLLHLVANPCTPCFAYASGMTVADAKEMLEATAAHRAKIAKALGE